MRIIAGSWRGRNLATVGKGDPGTHLRPTTDRIRESLFSTLSGGHFDDPITDAQVLDLFAGTGALGLEALSRGADHATFVDDGRKAQSLIRQNIASLACADRSRLITRDARRLPANTGAAATLVFLDPPYGKALGAPALAAALAAGWIADKALVVWEDNAPQPPPPGFTRLDSRRYGDTHVTFLRLT
ncbi:16S rRNA (guanine(966)-N(2))-methyltransferase RsmD [Pseudooceanicola sp.]|uniref:16S rRNA (guanine(966)-N(2))-methyltransferase RsmD n=1 Tax=Pseudooceanicola sp. TaxID=1914328 RepID=UPI0026314964|nr:16S rRNA (guanine(966)-N(2))-methyltransferase RsmD [Pseudooceanicola sp.]MDF1856149.1 16S rRNA (guanine(966)-N(2))-methyltransferase RsmD [Pseudooceanicola sp.]